MVAMYQSNEKNPQVIRITNMNQPSATSLLNRLLARGKLRHFQVLLQLAELGSVQGTAQAIGMTQSAVTQNLAYLERLLETPLFIRHSRGVLPTPAAQALMPTVRQWMQGISQGADALAAARREGRQTLRLLCSSSALSALLLPRMSAFVRTHPDIRIELQEAEGEDLLLAIAREQTDLVVCRQPPVVPAGWGFVPLVSDRFAVVASPGDPLLGKRRLSWDRLQARQWLLSSVHTQARQRFEALCSNWPQPPDLFAVVTRSLPLAAALIREHGLLGFMPHSFLQPLLAHEHLVALDVRADLAMAPIGLLQPLNLQRESAARFAAFWMTPAAV